MYKMRMMLTAIDCAEYDCMDIRNIKLTYYIRKIFTYG